MPDPNETPNQPPSSGEPFSDHPYYQNQQPYFPDPNQQPYYQNPNQQPYYQDPNQQPYYQNPNQQPYYQNPNQQPYYQNPNQQPYYQDPNQQPYYQNPNQQPYYQNPNQQPYYQNPNQQQYYPDPNQQQGHQLHPSYQPGARYQLPGLGEEVPGSPSIMVLGVLSIVLFFIGGVVPGGIALYRTSVARAMIEQYPGRYTQASILKVENGRTCAIVGIIISFVFALFAMYLLLESSQNEPYADPYAY